MLGERRRLFLLAIVLAATLPYLNSLRGEFVWDDTLLIVENRYVKDWRYLPNIFTESMGAGVLGGQGDLYGFYRPLPILALMTDYALFGLRPAGYHATNLILHVLTGLAIFWLVSLLFSDALLALFTALLFVVHPINTEVVSFISGRDTGLAALFLLACCSCFVTASRARSRAWYIASLATFVLSLLSKELAVMAPVLLYACAVVSGQATQALVWRLSPFLILDLAWVGAKLTVLRFSAEAVRGGEIDFFHRVTGFFASLPAYAGLLLWPRNQHVDYGFVRYPIVEPVVLLGVALFAAGCALCIFFFSRSRVVSFALAWLVLNLVPYCGIYPTNAYMAEHWLVVPSLGCFLLIAVGAARLLRFSKARPAVVVVGFSLLLVALGIRTAFQNRYWRDPETFYTRTIRFAPRPHLPELYFNLGNHFLNAGNYPRALQANFTALELDGSLGGVYDNLGGVYNNIGAAYERTGRYDAAAMAFQRALALDPSKLLFYRNLAKIYLLEWKNLAARVVLDAAARLAPEDPEIAEMIREVGRRRDTLASPRESR